MSLGYFARKLDFPLPFTCCCTFVMKLLNFSFLSFKVLHLNSSERHALICSSIEDADFSPIFNGNLDEKNSICVNCDFLISPTAAEVLL